jgi:hypothetical protein
MAILGVSVVYVIYFGVGLATMLLGLGGFYLGDYLRDDDAGADADPADVDATLTFVRAIGLFVAIVGFGGVLFGGVGLLGVLVP